MKRKALVVTSIVLALGIFGIMAAPVFAADPAGSVQAPSQGCGKFGRAAILARLLLVQDQSKVESILAEAVTDGKINSDQAAKIEEYWVNHHATFTKRVVVGALIRIQDEDRLQTILDNALSSGKITQLQADRITQAWETIHNK